MRALKPIINRMTYDGNLCSLHDSGKLLGDVLRHVVVLGPSWLGRIEVESSAGAEVPVGVLAFYACAARGCVGKEDGDTLGCGDAQEIALLCTR